MGRHRNDAENLEALDRFWRCRPFHDRVIEEVSTHNRRVVIRLMEFTLIVTGATDLERCDLPSVWLYEAVTRSAGGFLLDVETETGHLKVSGVDVRLIRNRDQAMLIPPIDT